MTIDVTIARDTDAPSLTDTITVNGSAVNLTDATVRFRMRPEAGTTLLVDGTATVTNGTAGSVRYDWGAGDLATAGVHRGWWQAELATGDTIETDEFPVQVVAHAPAQATRDGVWDVVRRVRQLTGAGTAAWTIDGIPHPSDVEIQEALDRHALDLHQVPIRFREDTIGGGSVSWTVADVGWQHLEAGTAFAVEDSTGAARATADYTLDAQRGIVTFTTDQAGTVLYVTGRSFDVHAAAADILEQWAAAESVSFDFTSDASRFQRSQKAEALQRAAGVQRRRARPRTVRLTRGDG